MTGHNADDIAETVLMNSESNGSYVAHSLKIFNIHRWPSYAR